MEEVVLFAASSELGRRLNFSLEKSLGLNTAWPKVGQLQFQIVNSVRVFSIMSVRGCIGIDSFALFA